MIVIARRRPLEVSAIQFTKDNLKEVSDFSKGKFSRLQVRFAEHFFLDTLEGKMAVDSGDWVVKSSCGDFYICKDNNFKASYDILSSNLCSVCREDDVVTNVGNGYGDSYDVCRKCADNLLNIEHTLAEAIFHEEHL